MPKENTTHEDALAKCLAPAIFKAIMLNKLILAVVAAPIMKMLKLSKEIWWKKMGKKHAIDFKIRIKILAFLAPSF